MRLWPPNDLPPCPPLTGGMVIFLESYPSSPYLLVAKSKTTFYVVDLETYSTCLSDSTYVQERDLIRSNYGSSYQIAAVWKSCKEYYKDNP